MTFFHRERLYRSIARKTSEFGFWFWAFANGDFSSCGNSQLTLSRYTMPHNSQARSVCCERESEVLR